MKLDKFDFQNREASEWRFVSCDFLTGFKVQSDYPSNLKLRSNHHASLSWLFFAAEYSFDTSWTVCKTETCWSCFVDADQQEAAVLAWKLPCVRLYVQNILGHSSVQVGSVYILNAYFDTMQQLFTRKANNHLLDRENFFFQMLTLPPVQRRTALGAFSILSSIK